jgi:hypothetical protein
MRKNSVKKATNARVVRVMGLSGDKVVLRG